MALSVGQRVRVTGHPPRLEWLEEVVGKEGNITRINENGKAYRVEFEGGGSLWFGASYLEKT